jgi:hypothetical protein
MQETRIASYRFSNIFIRHTESAFALVLTLCILFSAAVSLGRTEEDTVGIYVIGVAARGVIGSRLSQSL